MGNYDLTLVQSITNKNDIFPLLLLLCYVNVFSDM